MQAEYEMDQRVLANNSWRLGPVLRSTKGITGWCSARCFGHAATSIHSQPATNAPELRYVLRMGPEGLPTSNSTEQLKLNLILASEDPGANDTLTLIKTLCGWILTGGGQRMANI
jgi:hypothetical protein